MNKTNKGNVLFNDALNTFYLRLYKHVFVHDDIALLQKLCCVLFHEYTNKLTSTIIANILSLFLCRYTQCNYGDALAVSMEILSV